MKITNLNFGYSNSKYEITFIEKNSLRVYPGIGKTYPKTTQCIVKKDNLIIGLGTVTKHSNDKDNPKYARTYAAKQAINNGNLRNWKELRKLMWNLITEL